MRSILVRFTKREYAEQFAAGHLSLSSLSTFWQLPTEDALAKGVLVEQLDCSEGVGYQIPADIVEQKVLGESIALKDHIVHDVRFRFEAYGFCNLLCFYRIDFSDASPSSWVDPSSFGTVKRNYACMPSKVPRIINAPPKEMFSFGDTAILIRDVEQFVGRILPFFEKEGRACVVGDIEYHRKHNRFHEERNPSRWITFLSMRESGLIYAKEFIGERKDALSYGALDKFDRYQKQKEWRICWLPNELNQERKTIDVGDLHDLVEVIPSDELYERLQQLYPGYCIGEAESKRLLDRDGTHCYREFKRLVESLDGLGRIMIDVGV